MPADSKQTVPGRIPSEPGAPARASGIPRAIVCAGIIAGTLDITSAFVSTYLFFGRSPLFVLRFIASGVFGNSAFTGGVPMALAGLFFHYLIAFSWVALFIVAARKAPILVRRAPVAGIIYGLLVWLVMNLVIVPLSLAPRIAFSAVHSSLGALYLVLFIGLPAALISRRFLGDGRPAGTR
jgi:hypothetical protein